MTIEEQIEDLNENIELFLSLKEIGVTPTPSNVTFSEREDWTNKIPSWCEDLRDETIDPTYLLKQVFEESCVLEISAEAFRHFSRHPYVVDGYRFNCRSIPLFLEEHSVRGQLHPDYCYKVDNIYIVCNVRNNPEEISKTDFSIDLRKDKSEIEVLENYIEVLKSLVGR